MSPLGWGGTRKTLWKEKKKNALLGCSDGISLKRGKKKDDRFRKRI